ncbi:MAG: glucokinase [Acidobacteriota bacterium]
MRILSGDIGGTNSRFAVLEARLDGRLERARGGLPAQTLPSMLFGSLEDAAEQFLGDHSIACDVAAFGVPGPVIEGRCRTTNLPWTVEVRALESRLGLPVVLMNDLEAQALGLPTLDDDEVEVLYAGAPRAGNGCLIAAGTGLGQAGMFWDGARHIPFATEGGHASFAPRGALEVDLLRYWAGDDERPVSWENLVTGGGLCRLHEFVGFHRGRAPAQEVALAGPDEKAAVISRLGLEGSCASCREALELFIRLYGAEAGNLALKTMAVAGVWVGGGIAPKILPLLLADDAFRTAFVDKGPMRPLLEAMPIRIVLAGDTALRGAARAAVENARADG